MDFSRLWTWLTGKYVVPLAKLRICDPINEPRVVRLARLPAVIGRSPQADVRLTDLWVSNVHCCLAVLDGWLWIRDLESRHGTVVNGKTTGHRPLAVGDTISIGMSGLVILSIAEPRRLLETLNTSAAD